MGEKKEMNVYVYVFMITSVTALILSLLYTSLDPIFQANKAEAKKVAILSCIPDSIDLENPEMVKAEYNKIKMVAITKSGQVYTKDDLAKINETAVSGVKKYSALAELDLANEEKRAEESRLYPVYEYNGAKGKTYIVAIRGNGLWDKIWGYIALEDDLNTIAGVFFDHKGETPGLGAEIKDNSGFKEQFIGKKIFEGTNVALTVLKRKKKGEHFVTGISGATITCDGVTAMFDNGMSKYESYFEQLKLKK